VTFRRCGSSTAKRSTAHFFVNGNVYGKESDPAHYRRRPGGAIIGSFVMMLYASTHFDRIAGPNNTPPAVAAAALTGVSDQDRIVSAVKRTKASVVAIQMEVNGQQLVQMTRCFSSSSGSKVRRRATVSRPGVRFRVRLRFERRHRDQRARRNPADNGHVTKLTVVLPTATRCRLTSSPQHRRRRRRDSRGHYAKLLRRWNWPTRTNSSRASGRSRSASRSTCSRP